MNESTSIQTNKQAWLQPIIIGLLVLLTAALLGIIWFDWLRTAIYDKYFDNVAPRALWSIILLLFLVIGLLWTKLSQKIEALKKRAPTGVVLLPTKNDSELEKQVSELQNRLSKYENREIILSKYDLHDNGYYIHKETNNEYCPKCMRDEPLKESPLTKTKNDFICETRNCDYSYRHTPLKPPNFGKSAWEKIDS